MIYEILDAEGNVVNTIEAEQWFVDLIHPGRYREIIVPKPVKTFKEIEEECIAEVKQRLDNFAQTKKYDNILSLCTYASSTNAVFSVEGQYGVSVRDATWAKLNDILAEIDSLTRPMPSGFSDIESLLPNLAWPEAT